MTDDKEYDVNNEALKLFLEASSAEANGDVSLAIKLYSQAYKLDPIIDKHPLVKALSKQQSISLNTGGGGGQGDGDYYKNDLMWQVHFKESLQDWSIEDIYPANVWIRIFNALKESSSPVTFEQCTLTCKYLWLLSRRLEIDRLNYIQSPRLRMDGVYISKITYWREGESSFQYTHPIHLITYYRYLRFFQDDENDITSNGSGSGNNIPFRVCSYTSPGDPKVAIDLLRHFPNVNADSSFTSPEYMGNIMAGIHSLHRIHDNNNNIEEEEEMVYIVKGLLIPAKYLSISTKDLRKKSFTTLMAYKFEAKLYNSPASALHRSNRLQMLSFNGFQIDHLKKSKSPRDLFEQIAQKINQQQQGQFYEPTISLDVDTWSVYKFSRVKSYNNQTKN